MDILYGIVMMFSFASFIPIYYNAAAQHMYCMCLGLVQ